jgi:hypothetical protein|nr:MAG TPA: hypothetical protein [Bacteriophage sp.]
MRLIDADALKKDLKSVTLSNGTLVNTNAVLYLLEEYPTAYDVDKVMRQLEKDKFIDCETVLSDVHQGYNAGLSRAIEIVKAGGNF